MTTPGADAPEGAFVLGSGYGQDVTEQSFNAAMRAQNTDRGYREGHNLMQGLLGNIVGWISTGISDLISAFFGNYTGDNQDLLDYQSAQLELNDRLDLLDDVSGYASAYMSSNVNMGRGGHASDADSGEKFSGWSRVGPQKHALVKNDGIEFTQPGTWRIDAHMTRGGILSTIGSLPTIGLDLQVWGKNGDPNSVIDRKFYSQQATSRVMTFSWSTTVVLPPEYFEGNNPFVVIRVWHTWSSSLLFGGGSTRSGLSVNRWDLSTDGPLNPNPEVDDL